jgi:GNAT superfamily N-acetyltransferase
MSNKFMFSEEIKFAELTHDKWDDIEKLFGPKGACAGCWCMWWKLSKSQFEKQKGEKNKKAFKKIVHSNHVPGIIAYYKNEPIGWCAIEPRASFKRLKTSRILQPVDKQQVWSIVCFFIKKEFRRKGVSAELIKAAVKFAQKRKAKIIEGYPLDLSEKEDYPDTFAYHGTMSSFEAAGFKEVLRRSDTRPIMRLYITK